MADERASMRKPVAAERQGVAATRTPPVPAATAPGTRTLQQRVGNLGTQALAGQVAKTDAPAVVPDAPKTGAQATSPTEVPQGGELVKEVGIVAWDGNPQVRLRATPSTSDNNIILGLAFNTQVQVIKRFPDGWLFVALRDGRMGYVAAPYIWYAPQHRIPEPGARLHRVGSGVQGTAIAIAERYYHAVADDWGQDLRFYVNVIAAVNRINVPSGVSGWKSVHFDAGELIWIPSVAFARTLKGVVNSGSYSYEVADFLGIAGVIERIGELYSDFKTAVSLSGKYIPEAVARHAGEALVSVLASLALMAVGAILLLAIFTAIGAAIGGPIGAAAGFQIAMALIEWIGLAMLVVWIASSVARIGSAFATFFGAVWNARSDETKLDKAAHDLAEAVGTLVGVLIEAVVMYAAAWGAGKAFGALRGTAFGKAFGEGKLGKWLGERVANYNRGETPLYGPREVMLRTQAKRLAPKLGLSETKTLGLLRMLDGETLLGLREEFGQEMMEVLASRSEGVLGALARALKATGSDGLAREALMEGVRLNGKGTLPNVPFESAMNAYAKFRTKHGDRVSGDFISRFWRRLTQDTAQAEAELALAEDLLAGRTPLGKTRQVAALPEAKGTGEQAPEFAVRTEQGVRLAENKLIGEQGKPLTENSVGTNARKANSQLKDQAARSGGEGGEGGLVRLDGRQAGNTPVTPETLAEWVSNRIPSPRTSRATQWVEIFYRNAGGHIVRVVLKLQGTRFVVDSTQVMP